MHWHIFIDLLMSPNNEPCICYTATHRRYSLTIREERELQLINEDEKGARRNPFPLLAGALILWWCIQHGDVIAKSHLVLPDPIKSGYDGGNTDVWLHGPERSARWMSQKSQKTQFCLKLGILWPPSEKGKRKPTISFMSVEFCSFPFGLKDRRINQSAA